MSHKPQTLLVIASSPAQSKQLEPLIRQSHPSQQLYFFHLGGGRPVLPLWPDKSHWQDYPQIRTPQWRLNPNHDYIPRLVSAKGKTTFIDESAGLGKLHTLLKKGCRLLVFVDPTHAGSADLFLQQLTPPQRQQDAPKCHTASGVAIIAAKELAAVRVKQWFDYNFNLNSQTLLCQALCRARQACGAPETLRCSRLSKYGLQTLYLLKERASWDEMDLVDAMVRHRSSSDGSHGEIAVKRDIINQLCHLRLACQSGGGAVAISAVGQAFLNFLPAECRDPELGPRLDRWMEEGEGSLPAMERYLLDTFTRCKQQLEA